MRGLLTNGFMALPAVLASVPAMAQTPADRPDYWHDGWDWGWGWGVGHMAFGGLMMLLFWGVIIVVVVLVVRSLGSGSSHGTTITPPGNRALDILRERFARGDIDRDEFEERKRHLLE